jgi:hypothetical protein
VARQDLLAGTRLVLSLPRLLRDPVTPDRARSILEARLRRRDADFLALLRRILATESGPYFRLLQHAGCGLGDVERLVRGGGTEEALRTLARAGVYLTVEEFKGRRPVVRGTLRFEVDPAALRRPGAGRSLPAHTSGSRGTPAAVPIDLASIRDWAVDACLDYEARGGQDWIHARWTVPGGDSLAFLLLFCAFGAVPARWFSPIDARAEGLHPRYAWSARAVRWTARLAATRFPAPEHVPLDAPEPIARWLAAVRRSGRTPHLVTYVTAAVRVCEAGLRLGLDLSGTRFSVTGEPITAARLAAIRRTGAVAAPYYGSIDAGLIGAGCLAPAAPDDVHVHHDLVTLVQPDHGDGRTGLAPGALLVSSFRAAAPLTILNVSLGDQGVLEPRRCGCPLERVGWTGHLHTVRSFEKLTAAGMTFLDCDVVRVLEEVLPARFGGGPTDYQLVEDEGPAGQPRLRLLVHPAIGPLDSAEVARAFLAAIGAGRGAARVMALQWRESGFLGVERRGPIATASGKVLHLHRIAPGRTAPGRAAPDATAAIGAGWP